MHFLQDINSDLSVRIVCNKTGGTIKGDIKKAYWLSAPTGLKLSKRPSAHTLFMCFVFTSEQTATCATYSIIRLAFITEMKGVYFVVRTGSLNRVVCASSLKG